MLTPLESRILAFVRRHIAAQGRSPSLAEIARGLGLRSRGTVNRYVHALIRKGELLSGGGARRSLTLPDEPPGDLVLPFLGRVAAGRPVEAVPDAEEINLTRMFAGPERFILEVRGESMIDAGILPGDFAVIRRCDSARFGAIVLALVDEREATLKRLARAEDGQLLLVAENRTMPPLRYAPERVRIQGLLVGVVRSYR